MPEYDPVTKISIVPRGAAGGLTFFAPSDERLDSGLYRCVFCWRRAQLSACSQQTLHTTSPLTAARAGTDLALGRSKSYLENQMSVAMGGRVAEELIFGPENVTTGASNDFQQASLLLLLPGMCSWCRQACSLLLPS